MHELPADSRRRGLDGSPVELLQVAKERRHRCGAFEKSGAGDGTRTREYQLGKLGPYHLATPA